MTVEAATAQKVRSRARTRYNATLKTVRRAHMYAGLFLIPFVLLYGVSAFLFNHPDWFSDRSVRLIQGGDVVGTPLETYPTAEALAGQVIAALNREAGTSIIRLSKVQVPYFSRDLALTARTKTDEQVIFVELDGRVGTVRSAPIPPEVHPPDWALKAVHLNPTPAQSAQEGVAAVMTRWGMPPEEVKVRTPADLVFTAEANGETWRVAYNVQNEALSIRPWKPEVSTRRFLTSLHLACRYPTHLDARWFWALIVDAMAISMVFWGVSGLLMWWQMKSLRRLGTVVVALSAIGTLALALGMHEVLGR